MNIDGKLLDKLVDMVVEKKVGVDISVMPDCMEIKIEPWKPCEVKCPYGMDDRRVYAPFVRECSYCGRNTVTNIGSGISQPLIDWCRHTSYTGTDMPKVTLNGTEFGSKTSIVNMFREIYGPEDPLGMG